jgi:hypothetical protein
MFCLSVISNDMLTSVKSWLFVCRHFSETNLRAIDEVWYKRAVDQYSIEPESFVFSVPFSAASSSKPLVTATHALFVEHKGHQAPAAVVGLQFQHATLVAHFLNITSTVSKTSAVVTVQWKWSSHWAWSHISAEIMLWTCDIWGSHGGEDYDDVLCCDGSIDS